MDLSGINPMRAVRLDARYLRCSFVVGATGAVGTITKDDAGWTITRSDTGDYSIGFPKALYGEPPRVVAVAAPAVNCNPEIVTFSPTAGTATITFMGVGGSTPTDPDEAAVVYISILLDRGP